MIQLKSLWKWLTIFLLNFSASAYALTPLELKECLDRGMQFLDFQAPPAIDILPAYKYGYYTASTISIGDQADCPILMHELYHHYQFYTLGPAKNKREQDGREVPASKFELFWRGGE